MSINSAAALSLAAAVWSETCWNSSAQPHCRKTERYLVHFGFTVFVSLLLDGRGFKRYLFSPVGFLALSFNNAIHSDAQQSLLSWGSCEWQTELPRSHSTCLLHRWRRLSVFHWLWGLQVLHSVHVNIYKPLRSHYKSSLYHWVGTWVRWQYKKGHVEKWYLLCAALWSIRPFFIKSQTAVPNCWDVIQL